MLNIKEERKFLEHISDLITYWDKDAGVNQKDKLEGLAFSILSTIDGCSCVGEYALIPADDNGIFNISDDIGGCLHEKFYEVHRELSKKKSK